MRVFLAGATGVIGTRLMPLLLGAGHEVAGMSRSVGGARMVEAGGCIPVVCDVFDARKLTLEVVTFEPDLVMHQMTDLPDDVDEISRSLDANARVWTEGTRNLLKAADAAGVERIVAQSIAWNATGPTGDAVIFHEKAVLDRGGVVLRYGQFYGPGTYQETAPSGPAIHVDRAAQETLEHMDASTGVFVIAE